MTMGSHSIIDLGASPVIQLCVQPSGTLSCARRASSFTPTPMVRLRACVRCPLGTKAMLL